MNHALIVIITRDTELRCRGLLRSAMLEVSPGTYVSTNLNPEVRERLWEILERWHIASNRGSIIMILRNKGSVAKVELKVLGLPKKEFAEVDGMLLTKISP